MKKFMSLLVMSSVINVCVVQRSNTGVLGSAAIGAGIGVATGIGRDLFEEKFLGDDWRWYSKYPLGFIVGGSTKGLLWGAQNGSSIFELINGIIRIEDDPMLTPRKKEIASNLIIKELGAPIAASFITCELAHWATWLACKVIRYALAKKENNTLNNPTVDDKNTAQETTY